MSTLIFGRGFLGRRLSESIPESFLSDADITSREALRAEMERHRPAAVLNCAGKTGKPNVDWCETHPIETYRSNTIGPLVLAESCAEVGAYLLHLGSGCIFYGPSPAPGGWREDDHANPTALYSRTKYAADVVLSKMPNVGIARLRMPIDAYPGPRNLITKLARYSQVVDVENSVTVVDDLVEVVKGLVERKAVGIFHATNPGTMRHRDLLTNYTELVDPTYRCEFIRSEELVARGLAVSARSNCILSSTRLHEIGLTMRPIEVALRDVMEKYARLARAR